MISPLRFFTIAPLHSPYMLVALAAVLLSGILMLVIDPAKGADALAPLALLQMLAASSGFAVAARRGHLDLLLTAGPGRVTIALTHLALSIMPGALVWLMLGFVEMLVDRTLRPRAFTSGTIVSFAAISALAWAMTVRLPRLSGGIAWLLGIAVWIVGWSGGAATALATVHAETTHPLTRAAVVTLCPFLLLGRRLAWDQALTVLPVMALAGVLAASAVVWISHMDVPLESAQ